MSPTDGPDVGFVDAAEIVIDPSLPARWVLLAVRDSEMDQFFDENAYAVMPDGEGPFALWWRVRSRVAFKCGTVDEVEAGDKGPVGGPEPYTAWLCGPSIGELTVVTPDDPETHPFSRWLCETVRAACVGSG
ncbi:MAG TPA: hypothetical protein VFG68_17265 [Fimbriiglobus sp.]|nr:hypothetical protein [Fimbriiglobus sp.]